MNITVLNGSPKGDLSITLHYLKFLEKKISGLDFAVHHVSQKIHKIAKDDTLFNEILNDVEQSDAVIWSTPVYVCLIPSQYKRFIEMIFERGRHNTFKGKYTAVLTTSIHFFDHTANNYMRAICEDLSMNYVDFFSADMYDLMIEKEQDRLVSFMENFLETAKTRLPVSRANFPVRESDFTYEPATPQRQVSTHGKKVLVLTDIEGTDTNLAKMVRHFAGSFKEEITVLNLNEVSIKGGCLGCIQCGFDYKCAYTGTDEYIDFYNDNVKTADIIIYAGEIKDRFLSWKWKQFFDRRFFNTHTPTLTGKQVGFLVSGPLGQVPNIREIMDTLAQWEGANQADIVTDEYKDSKTIDRLIEAMAQKTVDLHDRGYVKPATFLGIGGMKIFRDDVWGRLRFPFKADFDYYSEHGVFDFPQNDTEALEFSEKMLAAIENPEAREVIRKMLKSKAVEPHQKIIEGL